MSRALRYLPLIGASLCALLATIAVWVQRQVLDTDTWTETSSKLLEKKVVRDTVATFLVDQLYANVDVSRQLQGALPEGTKGLSGPLAGGLRSLAERQAGAALAQPTVQNLWEQSNRAAHAQLVDFLEGDGDALSANQGEVTLDLRILVRRVGERVGLHNLDQRLPQSAAEIEIANSDQLDTAQDAVVVLKGLTATTIVLALLLYGLHIGLADGRRRKAIRQVGLSLIGVGIAVLALRQLGGRVVVDSLVDTASVEPAAKETWSVATELLASHAKALILYGVVAILGAFIAGPSRLPTDLRRTAAPWADEPGIAYTAFGLMVLGILLWAPTEGTRRLIPALILIAILAAGFEVLRRQIVREWPDAKDPDWGEMAADVRDAARSFFGGARTTIAGIGDGAGTHDENDRRLAQLERLGRLKESGVLTAREFTAEKKRILAAARAADEEGSPSSAKRSGPRRGAASRK